MPPAAQPGTVSAKQKCPPTSPSQGARQVWLPQQGGVGEERLLLSLRLPPLSYIAAHTGGVPVQLSLWHSYEWLHEQPFGRPSWLLQDDGAGAGVLDELGGTHATPVGMQNPGLVLASAQPTTTERMHSSAIIARWLL